MNRKNVFGVACLCASLLSAPAAAAQEQGQALPPEMKAMILKAMDVAEAKIFAAGPRRADWSKGGIDLRAAVAGKPGGLQENYLLTIDKDGEPSVTIYTAAPIASLVPANWKRISRVGAIDSTSGTSLDFASLEGSYYMVARGAERRVGDVTCSGAPVGADLYQAPGTGETEVMPAEVAKLLFEAVLNMTKKYTVCDRYEANGSGYRARYFFEDGRSLPALDESEDQVSIVPARPIDELLKAKAP